MRRLVLLVVALMMLASTVTCSAHFLVVYTPEPLLEKGGSVPLKAVFTHPFEAGHTMEMDRPKSFFVINKGKKTDLLKTLKPITWTSLENGARAWETTYTVRGMGDYVFGLEPEPYYEKSEGGYIQQFTKVMVNNAGLPTDWDKPVGFKAEIVPLDKPYALWVGNVFRGVVVCDGKPVADAEIEVEYLNHDLNMQENKFEAAAKVGSVPSSAMKTLTIKTNANGEFVFGIPKAGWWGFAALGVGPEKQFKGKELSQDAVIWIRARNM